MPYVALGVIVVGLIVAACWRIFKRVGWPPYLSLLCVFPLAIPVVFAAFALGRWPIEDELDRLRKRL